jgi:DNA helicase-2/ATP-dependent DNA helicase PcrA
MDYNLRPSQKDILTYEGGKMGVSAVPGSGKTWTLSFLAADIIERGVLNDDQEVLIVTLVNSAVDNFYQRVSSFIQARGLLPNLGYRVRTLHGLAHDIVRQRPELLGLDNNFQIIDERESRGILNDVVQSWLHNHMSELDAYLNPENEERHEWIRRDRLPELIQDIALSFIKYAKDNRVTPHELETMLGGLPVGLELAKMGCELYKNYQRALLYRGAVDFDDLIHLALEALNLDSDLLNRLQYQWPYILEDEAQDSSHLQEEILKQLSGENDNWVRVGDPNQAIYETFTTANPRYLREFITDPDVTRKELPNSGRSTLSIIKLANYLVQWTQREHPIVEVRDALGSHPEIKPTPLDDPQPNPTDESDKIFIIDRKFNPDGEIQAIADSLERWLPNHKDDTVAVLTPRNHRAFELVDELKRRDIGYHDGLLRSSSTTRFSAGALGIILRYLSDPQSAAKLSRAYQVWRREDREDEFALKRTERNAELLKKCTHLEDYLWPMPESDWLEGTGLIEDDPESYTQLNDFRDTVRRWQAAITLPIDQLILNLAQDLLTEPNELALTHKLASLLKRIGNVNPDWRLPELANELVVIARNERRFLGFSEDEMGFNPDKYQGSVVVSTMHKAKGLEWDRVYLMSVNNYDFPSGMEKDHYIAEKWFIRDDLNLVAETLAQFDSALNPNEYQWYEEGEASLNARLDYVRERLRLFYVGITRAKKELVITWNDGRMNNLHPSVPLQALAEYREIKRDQPQEP